MTQDIINTGCKLALEEAEKSSCKKRKVGAIIVDRDGIVLSKGHNHGRTPYTPCEDELGNTRPEVVHAEIATIKKGVNYDGCVIFVTHQPCENCQRAINEAGLELYIVNSFMKFDAGKLRYSLIPPEVTKALAEVLTYGAKKYKPNNWRKAEDNTRYIDALFRHLEDWRAGVIMDNGEGGSGLRHLALAMTNIGFLLCLELDEDSRSGSNID